MAVARGRTRSIAAKKAWAATVRAALERAIPEPRCELAHEGPFQLLVATILSAQTTDKGVNKVTPELFRRFPTPEALARAQIEEVEEIIRPTGYFRTKARHIVETARRLVEQHGGVVPTEVEALVALPGVARKTANVVLGTGYGVPSGFVVDTHVARVSQRLGLTRERDPARIEAELMALFPRETWIDLGHRFVLHGRYTCLARGPRCDTCGLRPECPAPEAKHQVRGEGAGGLSQGSPLRRR